MEYGRSNNLNLNYSGRPRTVRTQANVALVRRALLANPQMSSRRNAVRNVGRSSFNRITWGIWTFILIEWNEGMSYCLMIWIEDNSIVTGFVTARPDSSEMSSFATKQTFLWTVVSTRLMSFITVAETIPHRTLYTIYPIPGISWLSGRVC